MKLFVPTALALCLSVTPTSVKAQTPQFTDPANLRGERVQPRDGRELPIDQGALGLEQLLRKLNTRASVMNIVAHPDDEDGGMLTLYSRGLGARVADLSLNRGEGGQNAMTGDFEDALGLLRTQELLASDRYTGVDQFFGTEVDFGFSKTKEEAFAKWGHDRVLYDVVRAIRLYRPLVLTSTWIGGVTDGHGQHQVSGQIAQEAFVAAGDPKVFPELTAEGILPWQPLRIYARVPMQAITDKGLYDYATGQYTPAKFTNYVTGEITTTVPSADVIVHEGTPDPLLTNAGGNQPFDYAGSVKPLTYVQFARLGLGQQKSQVSPTFHPAPSGTYDIAYHLYGDRTQAPTARHIPAQGNALGTGTEIDKRAEGPIYSSDADPNFFTGIDTSLEGLASKTIVSFPPAQSGLPSVSLQELLRGLSLIVKNATDAFDPKHPEAIAPLLAEALRGVDVTLSLMEKATTGSRSDKESILHELRIKRVQINDALILSFGLTYTADVSTSDVPTHTMISAHTHLAENSAAPYDFRVYYNDNQSALGGKEKALSPDIGISRDRPRDSSCTLDAANSVSPTRPYFSRSGPEQAVYTLSDPALRNAPATPSALTCLAILSYQGAAISLSAIATHTTGSAAQPVSIVPPDSLSLPTQAQVFPVGNGPIRLTATVTPFTAITSNPTLTALAPWQLEDVTYRKTGPNIYTVIDPTTGIGTTVWHLNTLSKTPQPITVQATATYGGDPITEGYRPIGYGDLPRTNYFTAATTRIVPVDLKLPTHHNIAYLAGTGDAVPEALTSIAQTPTILTVADLTADKLKPYDTVILGVRTYAAHPDLHGAPTQALLDYARSGGNVVVQYQTPEFTAADAPYPLSLGSNEKVVDETAPVQLLPQSLTPLTSTEPLLTTPNRITPADFNNWVEERGHGFLATWDSHYTTLTEAHDPGQAPQRGGLITTAVGKGRWTYCAFALYRQLPEAIPGAFRLFVNLINP